MVGTEQEQARTLAAPGRQVLESRGEQADAPVVAALVSDTSAPWGQSTTTAISSATRPIAPAAIFKWRRAVGDSPPDPDCCRFRLTSSGSGLAVERSALPEAGAAVSPVRFALGPVSTGDASLGR